MVLHMVSAIEIISISAAAAHQDGGFYGMYVYFKSICEKVIVFTLLTVKNYFRVNIKLLKLTIKCMA